ncbi:MAG: exodeoxyribonuclease VII large subunit [Pyrinomonadaceae bacterium]
MLASLFDEAERRPWTVTELTARVKGSLEGHYASVWIEGEISNFKAAASGHWYFTLKDTGAQLRASCFRGVNQRIRFKPRDGLLVRARGRITVYEPRGDYQLTIEGLEPAGAGALAIAFEQLKEKLAAEGLFARELKRPLPHFPRRVGVVTSPTGAAIRDILNVISRRTRTVHVLFAPAKVQGIGSGAEIIRAIALLNQHHQLALDEGRTDDTIDVLIVGRGGGSAEDLWAFNEEAVVRAIRSSVIPVISAVGHETDFTIADFVADLRAPTPSAAAELVAAHEDQLSAELDELKRRLVRGARTTVADQKMRVQQAALSSGFEQVRGRLRSSTQMVDFERMRLEKLMARQLEQARRGADELGYRLSPDGLRARLAGARSRFDAQQGEFHAAGRAEVERARARFALAGARLDTLSPLAVLGRGYALALSAQGEVIRDAKQVNAGDDVRLRLAAGSLDCRVIAKES